MSDGKNEKTASKPNANDDAAKVKLLVTCIKHKSGEGINWKAVAEECEILGTDGQPSKGAASKRYERILKAYGVEKPAMNKTASTNSENGGATPKKNTTPRTKADKEDSGAGEDEASPSKKRKKSPVKPDSPVETAMDELLNSV